MKVIGKTLEGSVRRPLLIVAVAAISLTATTTVTTAAWTDNEWVSSAAGVASPGDCATNSLFSSQASSRQLTGMVLGSQLDSIAGIEGLTVLNGGAGAVPSPQSATPVPNAADTFISKLPVTALGTNPITAGLGLGVPTGGLGTYTQWAQSLNSGQSRGAAGLVTDQSGAVNVAGTATGAATAPKAASISLGQFLPASLAGVTLDVGAVASSATIDGCTLVNGWPTLATAPAVERNYGIAGLDLSAAVPALRSLSIQGSSLAGGVPAQLDSLTGPGGLTTGISTGMDTLVAPLLGSLDSSASTVATLTSPDLSPVAALMTARIADGDQTVTIDLAAGVVEVDIARLAGGTLGLNGRQANQAVLLDDAMMTAVTAKVTLLLDQWRISVVEALKTALEGVVIEATTTVSVLGLLGAPVATIDVKTGPATLGQFLAHGAPPPRTKSTVLGAGIGDVLLDSVVTTLTNGANDVVLGALQASIFNAGVVPGVDADLARLSDAVAQALSPILVSVATLVSIHVNVQPDMAWQGAKPADVSAEPGEYKVSAVRVGLIDRGDLLSLSLGTSSAGPVNIRQQ